MSAPSMSVLFPACAQALESAKRPLHYKEIARRGLSRLGAIEDGRFDKIAEDVREKCLKAGRCGTMYAGEKEGVAQCVGAMRRWFRIPQEEMNFDHIDVPITMAAGALAASEFAMRWPHLMAKNPRASEATRRQAGSRGFVREHVMRHYFRRGWEQLYREADNYQQWGVSCSHDMKLSLPGGREIVVDIWGVSRDEIYHAPVHKTPVHLHLQCKDTDSCVRWQSVVPKELYRDGLMPSEALSPSRLVVYLNCLVDGLDHGRLCEVASAAHAKRAA